FVAALGPALAALLRMRLVTVRPVLLPVLWSLLWPLFRAMLRPALAVGPFCLVFRAMLALRARFWARFRTRLLPRLVRRLVGMRRLLAGRTRSLGTTARTTAATAATAAVGRFEVRDVETGDLDAGNGRADQLLDRLDEVALGGRRQREGMADLAGTAGAADAMHIVLGRERHVEI